MNTFVPIDSWCVGSAFAIPIFDAVKLPVISAFDETMKPVLAFVNCMVLDVTLPWSEIDCKVVAILDSKPPSPSNWVASMVPSRMNTFVPIDSWCVGSAFAIPTFDAVKFPVIIAFDETTKPVLAFVNCMVLDVTLPWSDMDCNVVAILESNPPSPENSVALTLPLSAKILLPMDN